MRCLRCVLGLLLIGAVALPLGCGSSSTPADPPPTPELVDLSGSVTGYDADDHVIRTSFGEGLVGADGSFTVSIPAGGGCQLAFLVAPDDTPALLGWLGGSRTTVDTRSTAEVLAYFALGGYLLPLDNQTMLIEALEQGRGGGRPGCGHRDCADGRRREPGRPRQRWRPVDPRRSRGAVGPLRAALRPGRRGRQDYGRSAPPALAAASTCWPTARGSTQ